MIGATRKAVFGLALLAFGFTVPGAVQPVSAQAADCAGQSPTLCNKTVDSDCTKYTICGVRTSFPWGLILCCSETVKTTNYYYYVAPR